MKERKREAKATRKGRRVKKSGAGMIVSYKSSSTLGSSDRSKSRTYTNNNEEFQSRQEQKKIQEQAAGAR
jgi:hypothetical protein